jgi:hypothetical protein
LLKWYQSLTLPCGQGSGELSERIRHLRHCLLGLLSGYCLIPLTALFVLLPE